jgi:hypothetical protein
LAAHLGLEGEPRGVVVLDVPWGSSACDVLKPRDVLLAMGGHPIDAEGFYRHPRYGRLRFTNIAVDGHLVGDVLAAQVLRNRGVLGLSLKLRRYPASAQLIPWRQSNRAPPYLVAGGLVFRELDADYLASWGKNWRKEGDTRLLAYWELQRQAQSREKRRIIILMYVLPDPYNIGYHDLVNRVVLQVNGRPIDSISGLDEAFQNPEDGFHRVAFHANEVRAEVVLDAATFEDATAAILETYGVPERVRRETEPLPRPTPPCPDDS